jgi:HK97 family phage major capsid protein
MASKLIEKRNELEAKQKALANIFEQAGEDLDLDKVAEFKGLADTQAKADMIRQMNDELTALGKEVESLAQVERAAAEVKAFGQRMNQAPGMTHPGIQVGQTPSGLTVVKSLGERFTESQEYQVGVKGTKPRISFEIPDLAVKTLMTTSAGYAPESPMSNTLVLSAQRRPVVASLIPSSPTSVTAIRYMEETTFTNAAAPVAEAGVKPESELAFTERTVPVEVIANWLPVTKQQLEDVPGIQSLINDRLTLMLMLAEEAQLLTGNGATPNLQGFLTKPLIQTQAKGAPERLAAHPAPPDERRGLHLG